MGQGREEPVVLEPYDPSWPEQFEAEATELQKVLGPWLTGPVEHIGSTAVAGLLAKPVIDVMGPVESLEGSRGAIESASTLGYCWFPYQPDVMHWFCKPSPARRTHHLHLVPKGSTLWRARLAFRDSLRADPCLCAEYADLKLRLAAEHTFDREAYTEGKTVFVHTVVERALARNAEGA